MEQFHLSGKRHSGRAVRVEGLDYIASSKMLDEAAKFIDKEATYSQLKKKEWSLGLAQFIVGVSEPCKDMFAADVKWKKLTVVDFEEGFGKYFTAKDMIALEAIYRDYHDITKEELDAITGKSQSVASEG